MFPLYVSTSGVTDGQTRKSTKLFSVLVTAVMVFSLIGFMIYKGVGSFKAMAVGDTVASDNKVLTVDPDKIGAKLGNEVKDDKQPVTNSGSLPPVSNGVQPLPSNTAPVSNIYNPVTGGYYASGDIAVSAAVMVDGECWAYNVKAQRVLLSNSDCARYLSSVGNMAKVANPRQVAAVRSQPVTAAPAPVVDVPKL